MNFTTGQRITTRGEDFLITDVTPNTDESFLLDAEGISELVKGKRFTFDTSIDVDIKAVDPLNTRFEADTDTGYRKTKLYIETRIRNSSVFSDKITIAPKAAFNVSGFQLTPTLKALQLPRPRLLIADGVGLGKTIEAGIFLAELMKRGKAKRIMVLALKSILGQFQQEMWNRFAIPLMRLDSEGIARIKTQLPANKNPFDYYDKTIVSIDTLKNNAKFRHYIEKSQWDVIVIDECHTVANIDSQRGNLAQFLATKCESLILTSATPHNGNKESFANLINMIEPTAIPKSGNYDKTHVDPYYVRRFKHDIDDDTVRSNFRDREIIRSGTELTKEEIDFLQYQQSLKIQALGALKRGKSKEDLLFAVGIFKAYMSSPKAALSTIKNRIEKVRGMATPSQDFQDSIDVLVELERLVNIVLLKNVDSKYKKLKETLLELGWSGKKRDERFVLFAERIATIEYLSDNLKKDFGLADERIAYFHGGFSDVEQQAIVEDFGKKDSTVRILLCSDAGAQGVNLHFYCSRMFNYDIPWSLITLEQRNGRIDRYGQKETPHIHYLISESSIEGLKTDLHIINRLTIKEEEVHKTLGDAGSVMHLHDPNKEVIRVTEAIIDSNEEYLEGNQGFDYSQLFEDDSTEAIITDQPFEKVDSIYRDDSSYYRELFSQLESVNMIKPSDFEFTDESYLELANNNELDDILYAMPPEAKPKEGNIYKLTLDKELVQKAIEEARKKKGDWAEFQMLYDLHPAIQYYMTKLEASVEKDVALAAKLSGKFQTGSAWYVLHGQVSNNLGQPVISDFFVVGYNSEGIDCHSIIEFVDKYELNRELYTEIVTKNELSKLEENLMDVITFAKDVHMKKMQEGLQDKMLEKSIEYEKHLNHWKATSLEQLEIEFQERGGSVFWKKQKDKRKVEIHTIADNSSQYMKDLTSLDNEAYIKVMAVFYTL
ncbi:MAG: DEAD/DEAH box helicase [Candidatus Brocadiales bacterium]|nr:DEAD/DEAH box helicase [Candidatus Brocadiales bacterium]